MDYTLTKSDLSRLKSKLTRAKNSKDPEKVLAACEEAFAIFEEKGYPDNWHTWNIAREDAQFLKDRGLKML